MRSLSFLAFFLISCFFVEAQEVKKQDSGIIAGNLLDSSNQKAIAGASIELTLIGTNTKFTKVSDKNGEFSFPDLANGYYSISISNIGFSTLRIDSIHVRDDRNDFNLGDLKLTTSSRDLESVIVYAEKPLVESKDGNITFNASESALAAGSNAGELLNNVPLVSKDPNGKILVRGKEPKILIDDKPVELNLQQMQDLLESLPGSSIEKIEVMTNPPPQYANEQGGIINIVTRKGRVGKGGRISITTGTRGEGSLNGSVYYRKNKIAINFIAGAGVSRFTGNSSSERTNFYTDSINHFTTRSNFLNKSFRPNLRLNVDYDLTKRDIFNFLATLNQNDYNNRNTTEYTNLNHDDMIYRLSERTIRSDGNNVNPGLNITYTHKGKKPGEQIRVIAGGNFSINKSNRTFYQQFFNPDHIPNGMDTTQLQANNNHNNGLSLRVNYDKPLFNYKTFISVGGSYIKTNSHVIVDAFYLKKPDAVYFPLDLLSNDFFFHQGVSNLLASMKQILGEKFSVTAGLAAEETRISFDLLKESREVSNNYWNFLPFANINKNWKDKLSLTLAYRRTIRRPGIGELNPTIDFSDPYNIRFGNYELNPSTAHNFDLVLGKNKASKYFMNLGLGYNKVEDIYTQIRTLLGDGKTQITWENISHRQEYEISTWNGVTLDKKMRVNFSASYTYNKYSNYDKTFRRYRDGGSFTTTLSGNYSLKDLWVFTGNFTSNRFANPQGAVNWNLSINIGIQKKFFKKRFITTLNFIDPFRNQIVNSYTYGKNFEVSSINRTQTKNYRLTLSYSFNNKPWKKPSAAIKK